jgi:predicted metalloprotease with PDZ domain
MSPAPVRYRIVPKDPDAHLFEVSCRVADPDPQGQRFALPAWIPGSYMIREFARHVVSIRACAGGGTVPLEKRDKHTWRAAAGVRGEIEVCCEVYAFDLSVRGAYLDRTQGFFNGTSVFLRPLGREERPCLVEILPPPGAVGSDWQVATTLPRPARTRGAARPWGFGLYRAQSYDELIDHPVQLGRFALARFEAGGVPHEVAISGRQDCDMDRLGRDLARICDQHIRLFEPRRRCPPFDRYLFLVNAVGEGYGGLEHRNSTALLCARADLRPAAGGAADEGYRRFLGLCSHEYFHAWNVKRIRPAGFERPDLGRENYTRQLWMFEGFTSYYDDLALVRAGVIALPEYLDLLGKTISSVRRGSGRLRQSVAESSFDAWIKYYRQDENAPNAVVSYYAKGALVALALDLTLRTRAAVQTNLDELMRALWRSHGVSGTGVPDGAIRRVAEELSGLDLRRFFARYVEGTDDPPLERLLRRFGIRLEWAAESDVPWLGAKTVAEDAELRLANVFDGGPARAAGLAPGDRLVAIDGLRIAPGNLERLLARRKPGDTANLHAFRRDELMVFRVKLAQAPKTVCKLGRPALQDAVARDLCRGWLGSGAG